MPKVLLVIPPCFTNRELDFEIGFPVNLLLLGHQVRAEGWDVDYLDMTLEEKEGCDSFTELDRRLGDPAVGLIGISNHTVRTSVTTRGVAQHVKSQRPDVSVVVGGVNATFMFQELVESCRAIDYVLRGYAQPGVRALLASLSGGHDVAIPGAVMRRNGVIHVEPFVHPSPEDFIAPSFDGLDVARYLHWTKTYPLLTHTGCGFACNFCTSVMPGPYQNKEVYRPVVDVLCEMRQATNAGFERFFMTANIFTSQKAYCLELCDALKMDANLTGASWVCMTRVEFIDQEVVNAMHSAGCENIAFGVETAGVEQWRSLKKGRFSEEVVSNAFRLTRKAGMETTAYVMLGAPEQTKDDIDNTIKLVRDLDPDYRVVSFFQPFPGTPYWESPRRYGLSEIAPLEAWNFHEAPICRTRHLDKASLTEAAFRLYLECDGSRTNFDPRSDSLEFVSAVPDISDDIFSCVRDVFSDLRNVMPVNELLENVNKKHGTRGRLIALYWLSAAMRDGLLRFTDSSRKDGNDLVGVKDVKSTFQQAAVRSGTGL